jgi:hypothetical protein
MAGGLVVVGGAAGMSRAHSGGRAGAICKFKRSKKTKKGFLSAQVGLFSVKFKVSIRRPPLSDRNS